jgi:hypothetical protein
MVSINPQRTEEERIVFEAVGWWQASSSELFKSPALDEAASFEWPAELKQKQLPDSWYWDKLKGRTHEHWDKNQKG